MPLEFLTTPQGEESAAAPETVVETPTPEPIAEPAPQVEAPEPEGQPRGPDGKFAPKEPATPAPAAEPAVEAQPPPVAQPAPTPEAVIPPGYVPVQALQEVRSELQALKASMAPPQRQATPLQVREPPDRYDDPEGYEAWRDEQFENRLFNERCNVSEQFARSKHGDEMVAQAQQWAGQQLQADPLFGIRLRQQSDPYGYVIAEYRKEQLASEVAPDELTAFRAWKAQQAQAPPLNPVAAPAPAVAPIAPAPPPPPASIASAPSAGGPAAVPMGPGQAFDGIFRKG